MRPSATPRPGHGDYAGFIKSQGARTTGAADTSPAASPPLVAAGAVAKQALDLRACGWASSAPSTASPTPPWRTPAHWRPWRPSPSLCWTTPRGGDAPGHSGGQNEQDSVGGAIECAVFGLPAGLGPRLRPQRGGHLRPASFAVPAVKGVDFGAGWPFPSCGQRGQRPLRGEGRKGGHQDQSRRRRQRAPPTACPSPLRLPSGPPPSLCPRRAWTSAPGGDGDRDQGPSRPLHRPRAVPVIEAAAALAACEVLGI